MTRLEKLRLHVKQLYKAKNPKREDWADWLYENHVLAVADHAIQISQRYGIDAELTEAAALLHDIADTEMSRFNKNHEVRSLEIAKDIMNKTGYSAQEIKIVVDDACRLHSCREGDERPVTNVGKVLATADALAHLVDDKFYGFALGKFKSEGRLEKFKPWVTKKLDQDYYNKIMFEEIRLEQKDNYEKLQIFTV